MSWLAKFALNTPALLVSLDWTKGNMTHVAGHATHVGSVGGHDRATLKLLDAYGSIKERAPLCISISSLGGLAVAMMECWPKI